MVLHLHDHEQVAARAAAGAGREPRIGARFASDHKAGDGAFLVWQTWDIQTGVGEVWGSLIEPLFGNVTDLGGASVGGGHVSDTLPKLGSALFEHHYSGVYSNNPVTMIISLLPLDVPFCTGVLHVNPDVALYFPLFTDNEATVVLNTPLPPEAAALLGVTLYEQWSEKDVLTSPCGKKLQLSNALAFEIE